MELARDLRPARAARLGQLAVDLAAVLHRVDHHAQARERSGVQAGVAQHEMHQARQAEARRPAMALEAEVVGEEKRADAGGVAAAAGVLQQGRVIQLAQLLRAEADRPAQLLGDPATALGVPGRLAFREVQRMAQRDEHLGQARSVGGRGHRGARRGCRGDACSAGAHRVGDRVQEIELGVHPGSIGRGGPRLKSLA